MKMTTSNLFSEKIRKHVSDIYYLGKNDYKFKFHINFDCTLLIEVNKYSFKVIALPVIRYSCAQPPLNYLHAYLERLVDRIENPLTYPAEIKDVILSKCDPKDKDYMKASLNLLDDTDLQFLYYKGNYTIASLITDCTITLVETSTGMKWKSGYIGPYIDDLGQLVMNASKSEGESVGRFWPIQR